MTKSVAGNPRGRMTIMPDNGGDQLRPLSNLAEIAAEWGDGRPQCGRDRDAAIHKDFLLGRLPKSFAAAEAGFFTRSEPALPVEGTACFPWRC